MTNFLGYIIVKFIVIPGQAIIEGVVMNVPSSI
jgi:hypothetical protein